MTAKTLFNIFKLPIQILYIYTPQYELVTESLSSVTVYHLYTTTYYVFE